MTNKKYEFTGETIIVNGHTLHRIRALIDIPKYDVKKGDLGGFIEKEENLSHEGDCWVDLCAKVYGDAIVFENSYVADNAKVYGDAQVFGNARVYRNARVFGDSEVFGNAQIFWDAEVFGNAKVSENAQVFGNAVVFGNAQVFGNAVVYECARVFGNALVYGSAKVSGYSRIFGYARVFGNAYIANDAKITKTTDILVVGPIGSRNDYTTFYRFEDGIMVKCGCFNDTIEEFEKAVVKTHAGKIYYNEYMSAIEFVKCKFLNNN